MDFHPKVVIGTLMSLVLLAGCGGGDDEAVAPSPVAVSATSATPSSSATPSPSSKPTTARATPKPKPSATTVRGGGVAALRYFKVTVQQVRDGDDVRVQAKVCLRRHTRSSRTRISRDPWSLKTEEKTVRASKAKFSGDFPVEGSYGVGQCASGWIPFPTKQRPVLITYKNSLGDSATWSAKSPGKATNVHPAPPPPKPKPQRRSEPRQTASYANCSEVRAAGKAPIYPGQPGWQEKFDRDNDGVGCESS